MTSVATPTGDDPQEPMDAVDLPARPAVIELAAAILIVSGLLGLVGTFGSIAGLPPGTESIVLVTAAINLGSLVIGLLVRFGRAWLIAVNYVAVIGFLDLLAAAGSGLALMLGVADVLVVIILFLNKPWFDALRRARDRVARERHIASPPVGGG